ncbi:MAG: thiamine pyrophosphate-dependent enzyme [Myxococcota bacterium]|nr:thiamine pyrophosphate-dependent enzyme [Myxococcota bacterium]
MSAPDRTGPGPDPAAPPSEEALAALRRRQPRYTGLEAGHRACQGCGEALAARLVTEAIGPDCVVANATGCLEVFSTPWPQSAWRMPWVHSVFENAAAVASGVEAALRQQGRGSKVLAFAGDGGTFDIGLQALSGMLERRHDVLFVCYDNEGYMNTGNQRSGSTPHAARTSTSPAGPARAGKRHMKKDVLGIRAAHHLPYAASASVAYPVDLRKKLRRAVDVEGPTFLLVHSPCPLGWGHASRLTIEVARLAVETGLFPLVELADGRPIGAMPIREPRPMDDYLRLQQRFAHLMGDGPRAVEERAHLQALADHQIQVYGLRAAGPEPWDTESADTVRRGGLT